MTATDLDLDALLDTLTTRAIERAADRPLVNEAGLEVSAFAAGGRLVVHPGDTILSSWGNATYDQTVQTYTSTADRDAQWPTPKDGAVCVTLDTNTVWVRQTGLWVSLWTGVRPAAAPRGALAQVISTGSSSSQTTPGSTPWISAPAVTTDGTRRLKISYYTPVVGYGAVGDIGGPGLVEGATTLQFTQTRGAAAGGPGQVSAAGFWQGVPTSGPHTYALAVRLSSGTSITLAGGASDPAILLVEDIGT